MDQVVRSRAGLAYRRHGSGFPVVLVHGIPGSGRAWDAVRANVGDDLEVIVPDLLGFGASAGPSAMDIDRVGPDAQAGALEAFLDDLDLSGAVLVGHDFGGPVCTLLAARRPDLASGLFVLAANVFPDTPIPFPLSLVTAPIIGPLAGRVLFSAPSLRMMLRQGVGPESGPPDADAYLGPAIQRATIATIFQGALTQLAEMYAPVERSLRDLQVPVVVGWGDRDSFFDVAQGRRTADAAGGRLRLFEGAGHFLPHERPTEVAEEIEKLVAEVRGRSGPGVSPVPA